MDPSGDNSPLWGAAQLTFPDFNRHHAPPPLPQPSQWIGGDPQQHQQVLQHPGYHPYPIHVDGNYTAVRSNESPEVVEADSTIVENCATIYQHAAGGYHQLSAPVPGELFPVPHENGSYPPAEANDPDQNMSPDGGYSSPGSEYYATYQLAPQAYSADSPYQNVDSPPETGMIKYEELEVKQEDPEVYRSDQFSVAYSQPIDTNSGLKSEDSKPIIHENIIIKPATNPPFPLPEYQQPQFQVIELQSPMNFQIQAQLPYDHTSQVHHQIQQSEHHQVEYQIHRGSQQKAQTKPRKPRRPRPYPIVIDGERPSTSKGLAPPETPSPRFRLLQANPPSSEYNKPEDESEENSARRSARPSVIESSDYKCRKCGTFFARQCGLTQHQKWIHAERKFPCERCGKKFPSKEDLAKHIKRHDMKDKPFKCPVCPKQFCHKNDLRRHMYRHEDTTPYMCDVCPKCFIRKDHLLAHQQSHDRREKRTHDKENGSPKNSITELNIRNRNKFLA
ncbi:Krueppel-like factor 3 isoform X2 [Ochlerotatus camptorhynchus]|uniref:Krueppel-like factor 3 isoform X2 n=1 Tax=Ochlerotatus camptorhynchus TaxID=644619 RepID=UPI0031DAC966